MYMHASDLLLAPNQMHNYLYRVEALPPAQGAVTTLGDDLLSLGMVGGTADTVSPPVAPGATLGAVQVQWTHCMGELGSHSSTPVTAPDAPRREVEVRMQPLPSALVVGKPQKAILTITNNLERPLHLQLQWRSRAAGAQSNGGLGAGGLGAAAAGVSPEGIIVNGPTYQNLGQLARGGQCVTSVELLPLHAGLHSLTGVVVMDMQSAQEFPQPSLTDVFVQPASTTEMSTVDASASASTSTSTTAPATSSSTSSSSAFMVEATTPGDGAGPSDGGGLLNLGGFVGGTEGSGQTAADIFGGGEAGGDFDGLIMPSPPGAGAAADVAAPPPLPPRTSE